MGFINDIPNYRTLKNGDYYYTEIPSTLWSEFQGLILRYADEMDLKEILDSFAKIIPCSPTTNWGYDFLRNDILDFVHLIKKKVATQKLECFMDCLAVLVDNSQTNADDINDWLEEHNIGYRCELDFNRNVIWYPMDESNIVEIIDETIESVKTKSQQALEELGRAKEYLKDAITDERARKDAVRSCVSAMEAIIKLYGKDKNVDNAYKNLRKDDKWKVKHIVKDGYAVFDLMHKIYMDLRHGARPEDMSDMTYEEAKYWIGRSAAYITYMVNTAKELGTRN